MVRRLAWVGGWLAIGGGVALAQQTIGSVAMQDATVAGALEVTGGRAVLVGSSSVTARDHAAEVTLARGGMVRVCQTSGVKLASGAVSSGTASSPLMLALDRGAIEVKMQAAGNDVILTPDLRFAMRGAGPMDLRLRVTRNGDTCVEQRETGGPTLVITDSFGEATYEVRGGQHVMFEHGSLREVVDHESSPCGCPEPVKTMSLAEAALRPPGDDAKSAAEMAAGQHPFPAAESTGLATGTDLPQAAPGTAHTQVAATLGYEGGSAAAAAGAAPTGAPSVSPVSSAQPGLPVETVERRGFRHSVGRFFRRLFGGNG